MMTAAELAIIIKARDEASRVIDGLRDKLDKGLGGSLQRLGSALRTAGQNATIGLTLPIVAVGGVAIKAAIDFETAFAGVRKTVDATEGEFAALEQGIRDMALTV